MYLEKERKVQQKTRPLTPRQREILKFIERMLTRCGVCPSVREIGVSLHIQSPSCVLRHLAALEKKGYIHREANQPRSIILNKWKAPSSQRFLKKYSSKNLISLPVKASVPHFPKIAPGDWLLVRPVTQLAEDEIGVFRDSRDNIHIGKCELSQENTLIGVWDAFIHNIVENDVLFD